VVKKRLKLPSFRDPRWLIRRPQVGIPEEEEEEEEEKERGEEVEETGKFQ
jgi:hypothetical protein